VQSFVGAGTTKFIKIKITYAVRLLINYPQHLVRMIYFNDGREIILYSGKAARGNMRKYFSGKVL
jgi:hypothetical protein